MAARLSQVAPALSSYLQASPESISASSTPVIAVGGSGGGFRAMVSYAAFLHHLQGASLHSLWPLISYTSGVSGSCWTLASLYTHANLSTSELLRHYVALASEETHPMSLQAFDRVARSRRGSYFLFGPLLRKMAEGARGGGVMDLYATLTTSFLLLPRGNEMGNTPPNEEGVTPQSMVGLSRESMAWSKVYQRYSMAEGKAPLPVLTAASVAKGVEEEMAVLPVSPHSSASLPISSKVIKSKVHWWEATPLEIGSSDVHRRLPGDELGDAGRGAFIPTWSFGRPFNAGRSLASTGEPSLSLLVGHCTSAPAGPLTGYITALLGTLPSHTLASWALRKLNDFLLMRRWRRRWGNPIRSSAEWNPFYGMHRCTGNETHSSLVDQPDVTRKLKLMDAGISNNLPAHVFYQQQGSSSRSVDIFIGFDASSDVGSWKSLQRVQDFAQDRGLRFFMGPEEEQGGSIGLARWFRAKTESDERHDAGASDHESQGVELSYFLDTMRHIEAQASKQASAHDQWPANTPCVVLDGYANHTSPSSPALPPRLIYIYVPLLLPPSRGKDEDWSFATVYNLVWTRKETRRVIEAVHRQLTSKSGGDSQQSKLSDFDAKVKQVVARVTAVKGRSDIHTCTRTVQRRAPRMMIE